VITADSHEWSVRSEMTINPHFDKQKPYLTDNLIIPEWSFWYRVDKQ